MGQMRRWVYSHNIIEVGRVIKKCKLCGNECESVSRVLWKFSALQ